MRLGNETISMFGPHRAPEWRWLRATWYRDKREASPAAQADEGVAAAYEFCNKLKKCRTQPDFERLYFQHPDEFHAVSFWVEPVARASLLPEELKPTIYDKRRQAAIEAYLLTEMKHDDIAVKLGVTPNVIGIYENWFFDFRPFLASPLIISSLYVRGDVAGSATCSFEHMLRLYGWKYGKDAVDQMLTGTGYNEKLEKHLRIDQKQHLLKTSAILARGCNAHPAVIFEATRGAVELDDKLRQVEIESGKAYESEEKTARIKEIRDDMNMHNWCMIEIPDGAEKDVNPVEHRLSVQLGYEKAPNTDETVNQG